MAGVTGTPSEPDARARKPRVKLPPGYDSEAAFLQEMRKLFQEDSDSDRVNRDEAASDIAFTAGEQWDDVMAQRRIAAHKPVLTVNRLPAFVGQVLGSRKQSETTVKIIPDNGGSKEIARVREGLIRHIQKTTRAAAAYDNALMGCVVAGIGNFQLGLDYESDDVFDQEFEISPILDHLAVVWDSFMIDATGRDARRCFVVDTVPEADFRKRYPWATPSDIMTGADTSMWSSARGWFEGSNVRTVDYWRMRTRKRTLALMQDGTTQDVTDQPPEILAGVMQRPDGTPIMREVHKPFAQKYVCSGTDILEGPYDLPIDRIPVFRVPGWEMRVGRRSWRWGLVRFLKDPQRLHNYWRSVLAEKLAQSPRNTWVAADTAVEGHQEEWRNSHLSDDPLLVWNAESGIAPQRQPPAQVETAFLQQAEISNQDIKDVSNIHEANLGMPSNEVSGVAITARQRVSDTGTIIYHAHLASAIEECGRVANQLIPVVYDTPRIIKIIGSDAKSEMVTINHIGNPNSVDIGTGTYNVSVVTGPAYETKRIETADNMLKLATAMPTVLGISADLIVEAQDWPGAAKIADRLRAAMPPSLLTPDEQTPLVRQHAAAQAQAQQQQAGQQQQQDAAKFMADQAKAELDAARAAHYQAQTRLEPAKVALQTAETASKIKARQFADHIAAIKA